MSAEVDHIKAMLDKHAPHLSRSRVVLLVVIATVFIWVLMGPKADKV
jgi:hypothetical protein